MPLRFKRRIYHVSVKTGIGQLMVAVPLRDDLPQPSIVIAQYPFNG